MKTKHYLFIALAIGLVLITWHNSRKATWIKRIQAKYPDGDAKTWSTDESPWTLQQLIGMYFAGHPALMAKDEAPRQYAQNSDGSPDYSHYADGTPVMFA